MSVTETMEELAAVGPRLTGSEGDKRAVELIADRLAVADRDAEVDDFFVRPDHHVSTAICAAIAVAGSVLSTRSAPAGLIAILVATVLLYLDLTARFYSFRYLLPRRKTSNVTSPGSSESARARVVVVAHHDSGRAGLLENRFGTRLPGPLGRMTGPVDLIFWLMSIALALAAIRVIGIDATLVTALQFVVAITLLVGVLALVDAAFAKPSPGASDNASGVAAALELGRRLDDDAPESLDVWLLFSGAQEGLMLGMRHWLRQRASWLKRKPTFFINLDTLGNGSVRFVVAEGLAAAYEHNTEMIELCESIADEFEARPHVWRVASDGVLPAMQGRPAITVCCLDEAGRAPNYHRDSDTINNLDPASIENAIDFTERLVREMDATLVATPASEPVADDGDRKTTSKTKGSDKGKRKPRARTGKRGAAERGF